MRQRPEIERQSLLVDDQGAGLGQNMSYVDSHERAGAEQKASQTRDHSQCRFAHRGFARLHRRKSA